VSGLLFIKKNAAYEEQFVVFSREVGLGEICCLNLMDVFRGGVVLFGWLANQHSAGTPQISPSEAKFLEKIVRNQA